MFNKLINKSLLRNFIIAMLLTFFLAFPFGCTFSSTNSSTNSEPDPEEEVYKTELQALFGGVTTSETGILRVHFIDVGQADCVFIEFPDGKNMIIDVGEQFKGISHDYYPDIKSHFNEYNVDEFTVALATHAHSDHIGLMDELYRDYKVNYSMRPFVYYSGKYKNQFDEEFNIRSAGKLHDDYKSNTYYNYIKAVKDEGTGYCYFNKDSDFTQKFTYKGVESSYTVDVLTPTSDIPLIGYDEQNNYSPIMTLEYAGVVFMFTGDAEVEAEREFLDYYGKEGRKYPDVDVLKVGHHGSFSSSSPQFIEAIKPEHSVIMCGGHSYGHPTSKTLSTLSDAGSLIYRTDLHGNIIFEVNATGNISNISTDKTATNEQILTPGTKEY